MTPRREGEGPPFAYPEIIDADPASSAIDDASASASSMIAEIAESELILGKELGSGSFGAVYKAEWFNAAVVVKVNSGCN